MALVKRVEDSEEQFVDELKPGSKLLHGQYTIERFLNAGGFGITYLARNSLDREVVIKECFPGSFCRRTQNIVTARSRAHEAQFAQIVRLFVQEAKSLSRLVHPNIVGVHQVFEENDTAYMAIDFIDGRDLLEIIETDRTVLSPQQIVSILKKLLGAIAFIHDNGMLHRDISPDNILIAATGEPVLIDFGAARQQATKVGGKALSALRVVKDGYSPQEFYVSGSHQTGSSDLYALAATFHHVITGVVPPSSQTRLVAIAEGTEDPYVPLAGRVDGYPPGFLEAIDDALRVLPKDRIPTAQDWLDRIAPKPELKVVPMKAPASPEADVAAMLAAQGDAGSTLSDAGLREAEGAIRPGRGLKIAFATAVIVGASVVAATFLLPSAETPTPSEVPASAAVLPAEPAALRAEGDSSAAAGALPVSREETAAIAPPAVPPEVSAASVTGAGSGRSAAAAGIVMPAPTQSAPVLGAAPVANAAAAEPAAAEPAATESSAAEPTRGEPIAGEPAALPAPDRASDPAASASVAPASVDGEAIADGAAAAVPAATEPALPVPDPTVLPQQVAAAVWDIVLPFRTEPSSVGGSFPQIVEVFPEAAASSTNDWIREGVILYAVKGEWVTDQGSIAALMSAPVDHDEAPLTYAGARIKRSEASPFEEVTLGVPVTREVTLINGVRARAIATDGAWRTEVTVVPSSMSGGLAPGDVLVAEQVTGAAFDSPRALESLLATLAEIQVAEARFRVDRGGIEADVAMPLARSR